MKIEIINSKVSHFKPYGEFQLVLSHPGFHLKSPYAAPEKNTTINLNSYELTEYPAQYILNNTSTGFQPSLENAPTQYIVTLEYFENRITTTEGVQIKDDGWHLRVIECHPRYWVFIGNNPPQMANLTIPRYESVVCISHQHASDFGHWFLEIYPALMAVPEEILHSSMIALPELHPFIIDHLGILGINQNQLLIGIDKPYFARRYYTMHPGFCGDINKGLIRNMRAYFIKKMKLDRKKPLDFLFLSRKGMSRDITNLDDLVEACKKEWPQFPWKIAEYEHSIQAQAIIFNNASFVYSVHGSSLANTIFMQPGTIVVELQMQNWLLSFIHLSFYVGLRHYVGRDMSISWRDVRPNYIDIKYNMELIQTALRNSGYLPFAN